MHVETSSRQCGSWSRSAPEYTCCEVSPQSGHPAARSEARCHPDTTGLVRPDKKASSGSDLPTNRQGCST